MRLDIENGVARVRACTAQEQEDFLRTHPNATLPTYSLEEVWWTMTHPDVNLPTYSLEEVNRLALRGLEELEKQPGTTHPPSPSPGHQMTDPTSDPSVR
jgi:hypothetical protein